MASIKAFLIFLVLTIELGVVVCCALWPLRNHLTELARARGWWQLGSFELGNLDVLVLAVAKEVVLVLLVASTPSKQNRAFRRKAGRGAGTARGGEAKEGPAPDASNHSTVRKAISVLCGLHAAFLLVKAAAVAVTAPEQLWPDGEGGGVVPPRPDGRTNVGLVFLYVSIGTATVLCLRSA
ncbi:hypothetical protein VOLCADRAFT_87743 [Volvox carteri f. nagariensis]|uniref:Uncharacterized protein n=1 Tax=Volvox carteri f. nagariensis TaxID=3068 RepID=D8TM47_VOLCA|nr:uncharacterized protein VOLCADRAFT_87743 [Volvox carteri f. nagariensis]EFJ51440.1 hypothetical protein VOLCADRAFT_87743 [Volvox carteri f. nagariensis]|eukprot:XP_002947392.1 hypothetical protein VOLCADRAFT_87743 [Volvox carteri f. nagariensis]